MVFEVTQQVRGRIERAVDEALNMFPPSMISDIVDQDGRKVEGREDMLARSIKNYEQTGEMPRLVIAARTSGGREETFTPEDLTICRDLANKAFETGMHAATDNVSLIRDRTTVEQLHVGIAAIEGALASVAPRMNGVFEQAIRSGAPECPDVEDLLTYDAVLFTALYAAARHRMLKGRRGGLKGRPGEIAHQQFMTLRGYHFHDSMTVACDCKVCKERKADWDRAEHKT